MVFIIMTDLILQILKEYVNEKNNKNFKKPRKYREDVFS
jgi:hypothetical protein